MQCPDCQTENRPGRRFCGACGGPLALACPSCGFSNEPGEKFCGGCGQPLIGPPAEASLRPALTPDAYTPKHLAEQIFASRGALEGERKQVTVLFADLKGSTELIQGLDPEQARTLLDGALQAMMEAVHRYEGTVNQVMGDGIMALFGAPIAHEDHAVRACYAALAMQEALRRYAEETRRQHGVETELRVGLNSGEVVVRAISSDLRMDYSAVGSTVHLAARMEQLASAGTIRLTAETLRLVEGLVQVKPLGPVPVKGLAEPVEVFELLGAGPTRRRLQATATRGLTRFVGREAEQEALHRALERAGAGHGQVVALVGEPGVGKSRLVWEFTHSQRTQGWLILESGSVSYGKATSYLPVIDLLKTYCQIEARDDARRIREKLTGKLLTLDRALEPTLPAFFALLDVPTEDPEWQALDPPQRRLRTLEACKRLLLRESQEQPLLLVFEDLHWIDSETQALLDSLAESLPTARLLLLVNYRPEYQHRWGSKSFYVQLRLDPLPPESADELLEALIGTGPSVGAGPRACPSGRPRGAAPTEHDPLRDLKSLLIERTEGNPFFLEESVRTLVETGVLVGERGSYQLARALTSVRVPATVQAVLAARIDRLPPEDKRLLQTAAVIGKDVSFALLEAVVGQELGAASSAPTPPTVGALLAAPTDETLRSGLARLQAAEFLYEASLFPDLEYTFKHALTHEVAYGSLLQGRRRELHARIVEAIEAIYAGRLAEQVERIAHHAARGELWEKAVAYSRQSGLRAMARAANREAVAYLEQALEALRRLPETRKTTELSIDIHIDLRNAFIALGEWARMGEHLHAAERLARTLGDQHRLARIATLVVWQRLVTGDYEEAVRFGQEALSIARTLGDRSIEVVATLNLGRTHAARGEFSAAAALLERNVALDGDLRYEFFGMPALPWALSGAWLAEVLSQLGRFDEAIGHAEAAVQIAEAADHLYTLYFPLFDLGRAHLRRGDLPRATQVLEQGLGLCRTWQIFAAIELFAATLGAAYALAGRADEALPLVADAVEESRRRQNHVRPAHILLCAGTTYLSAGRIDAAASHAQEALALARRLGAQGSEAHALCLAGDVALTGGAEDAEGYYRQALALAEELGMRPLQAHCRLGFGTLYRKMGRRDEARAALSAARDLYGSMEMAFWLPQVEAELALAT